MGDQDVRGATARAALDMLDAAVLAVAVDGERSRVVEGNTAAGHMAGLSQEDLVGHPLDDLVLFGDVAGFVARANEALHTGEPLRHQIDRELPAGHVTLEISIRAVPELGTDPPHVAVVLHDVTALRRVSDALLEVERATRTGTWSWDVTTNTVRWSSQLFDLFGLHRGDFEPSFEGCLACVHPGDRDEVEAAVEATFQQGRSFEIDHRVVTPAQQVRWLHCTGHRVDDLHGRPIRMHGTAQYVGPG